MHALGIPSVDNSHRLPIDQCKGILVPDRGECENGRIAPSKVGYLTMSATEATGGILHRP